jgi:glycosyltransferase involved in cell wall biosynthesis
MARVVHLADYGGPYPGSFVPMLEAARSAVEASGAGWSFEAVFTPGVERWPWYSELQASGARTRVAPAMGSRAAVPWLRSLLAETPGQTLLHTHFSAWDLPAGAAVLARRDAKLIWHLHTPLADTASIRARNLVKFAVVGRTTERILCVGPEIYEKALERRAPAARTSLFPNGVDFDRFALAGAPERAAARARLGLGAEATVLVSFAWDWERKGGQLFLDAAEQLRSHGQDVLSVPVVIEGRASELEAQSSARNAVRPMSVIDDVRDLYAAADVFVAASTAEGMPFSVLEALASGTAVVASDILSHRFIGSDLPTLRLVERSGPAIAAAIAEEIGERDTRERRGAETRELLEPDFSLARWTERLGDLYGELFA